MTPVCTVPDPGRHPDRQLVKIPKQRVHRGDNARSAIDRAGLQGLIDSLASVGQQVPIIVYPHLTIPGDYEAADGNRRVEALKYVASITEVEAIILAQKPGAVELKVLQLTLGCTNERLSPFDIADGALAVMKDKGINQDAMSQLIGISPSKLCHCLKISAHTAQEIRGDIQAGIIPFSVAAMLARLKDNIPAQIDLAAKVKAGLLVRDAVEVEVQRLLCANGKKAPKRKPVKLPGKTLSMTLVGDDLNAAITEANRFITAAKKALSLNLPPESVPPLMVS